MRFIFVLFASLLWKTQIVTSESNCNWMMNSTEIAQAAPKAVQLCLIELGKEQNIADDEAHRIWEALIEARGGAEAVSDVELRSLGWILRILPAEHLGNLSLVEVDTISSLGVYRNLSQDQLKVLAMRVLDDWGSKQPSDYTSYDLEALQHILCGFNYSEIEEIHPDAYKQAANGLSTLHGCSKSALKALASLATSDGAFGPTFKWSSSQTKHVGCIMNGLTVAELTAIPSAGWEALTPDIVFCLLPETLQVLSEEQLQQWTPSAVKVLSTTQRAQLSDRQRRALDNAFRVQLPSAAINNLPPLFETLFILVILRI